MPLIEWFTEPFALGFQQRALVGGILAGLMCAIVGTWLVLRGMAFFGDAFTHGVVPGIAAAVAFTFSPLLGAAIAAVVMLLLIETVRRHSSLSEDTAIGLLFVGMLSLGVVIISKVDSYTGSLTSILFGNALGVTREDIAWQLALGAVVISASILLYRPLLALSFNEQKAYLLGMRPRMAHAALLVLIATAVIGSFQAVGTLLVFALLVGPPATASLVARTVPRMMLGRCRAVGRVGVARAGAQLPPGHRRLGHDGAHPGGDLLPRAGVLQGGPLASPAAGHRVRRAHVASAAGRSADGRRHRTPGRARPPPGTRSAGDDLVVEAEDLELRYGSYVAIAASSLQIPRVGVVSVIGPNGSGKSTLLSALVGLVPVAAGTLRVLGADPQDGAGADQLRHAGHAGPRGSRPSRCGRSSGSVATPSGACSAGSAARTGGRSTTPWSGWRSATWPAGTCTSSPAGSASASSIAQGIVQEHELLVLDEPLTGLDITSAATIDTLIHEQLADGCTVILTTHDLDEARAADWVVLVSGRIVAYGPPGRGLHAAATSRSPTGWAACTTGRASSTTPPTTPTT